jgi:hypothetical protein
MRLEYIYAWKFPLSLLFCGDFRNDSLCRLHPTHSGNRDRSAPKAEAPPTPAVEAPPTKDLTFFDDIVTPEAVFPDPVARALYEVQPPITSEKGWRSYAFVLPQQQGMNPNRHFHIISVICAPAGTFHQGLGGTGGPGGGFVDWGAHTPDGKYDLRITIGMLLPDTVVLPEFDFSLEATAERLLLRYSQKLNNSLEGK